MPALAETTVYGPEPIGLAANFSSPTWLTYFCGTTDSVVR